MIHKIKKHAFAIVFGFVFALYFAFLMLIFFAPRVDLYGRGFVGCTKKMIADFEKCEKKKAGCAAKVMIKNHACDFGVVKTGFVLWTQGKQKTPWANYYFEPVTEEPNPIEDEELKAYYQKHVDIVSEMEELNQKYFELEKQLDKNKIAVPQEPQNNQGDENEQK